MKCEMCKHETNQKVKFDSGEERFICEYCKDELINDAHQEAEAIRWEYLKRDLWLMKK